MPGCHGRGAIRMTFPMLWLGYFLCALAGAVLLVMALHGRPSRGESLVGAHLATGPFAIVFCVGMGLVLWAAPLPSLAANTALAVLVPGAVVGMTFLPLAAYGTRRTGVVRVAVAGAVAAPFTIGHGALWHELVPWLGALALAAVGAGGTWLLVEHPMRRLCGRLRATLGGGAARAPSAWETEQAAWQRGEWAKVPVDAGVGVLLAHARSLAPDVRAACHARLAAVPDLDAALAEQLRGEQPAEALWYAAHHHPRSRAALAPALVDLLARLRQTWPNRMRNDPHPRPWTGDLLPALECAIAVLRDGGDVREELHAWQRELASMPKLKDVAKDLSRWLARAS